MRLRHHLISHEERCRHHEPQSSPPLRRPDEQSASGSRMNRDDSTLQQASEQYSITLGDDAQLRHQNDDDGIACSLERIALCDCFRYDTLHSVLDTHACDVDQPVGSALDELPPVGWRSVKQLAQAGLQAHRLQEVALRDRSQRCGCCVSSVVAPTVLTRWAHLSVPY